MITSRSLVLATRNVLNKICREYQNKRFMTSNFPTTPPPRKSRRLWDNLKKIWYNQKVKDENIIQRMRFSCRITKAKSTHSEYVVVIVFSTATWPHERVSTSCSLPVMLYYGGSTAALNKTAETQDAKSLICGTFREHRLQTKEFHMVATMSLTVPCY